MYNKQKNFYFLFFIFLLLILLIINYKFDYFNKIKFYTDKINFIFYNFHNNIVLYINNKKKYFKNISYYIKMNYFLKKKIFFLKNKLSFLKNLEKENIIFRNILNIPILKNQYYYLVKLLPYKLENNYRFFIKILNNKNINYGDLLFNGIGIIGRVISVNNNFSKVDLVCNYKSSFPGKILRSNIEFIVLGKGCLNYMEVNNLSIDSDIKVGDIISTYNYSNNNFSSFPLGVIKKIIFDEKNGYYKIKIGNFLRKNELNFLFLIK